MAGRKTKSEREAVTPGGHLTQAFVDLVDAGNAQAQLILKAIAQHADWQTGVCYPRVQALAEIGKCSDKTVRRYLHQMADDGLIGMEPGWRDNGSQTSNRITLLGYAEWIAAARSGGLVPPPKAVHKYETPPGQPDQGTPGQADQPPPGQPDHPGPGQPDQGPLDNLTGGPGQQVSTLELHLNQESVCVSARERDDLLAKLRAEHPKAERAIEKLIEPLLRLRLFRAPDKAFALGMLADWAAHHDDEILSQALDRVTAERAEVVKPFDVEKALKAAIAEAKSRRQLQPARPAEIPQADPAVLAKGDEVGPLLKARLGDEVYAAWFTGLAFERVDGSRVIASVAVKFAKTYIEQNYAEALEHCASRVFGHGTRVELVVRRQAQRGAA